MVHCPSCASVCAEAHRFCFGCGAELERAYERLSEDPLLGRTLPGGYRVTRLVGVGGMGRVYCADQVALARMVAVKVVHPHLAADELTAARFLNEARTASRLSHPNCVAIFDFGRTEDGRPYIVMEYLRGRDLGQIAQAEGPLSPRRVADVLGQSLAALEEAHALGIVHRDIKPDNIVLEPLRSGLYIVKVVDFGLAKVLRGDVPVGATTRPGLVSGTPEYMSPEQIRGDELDGRSDLYSMGVVFFELLCGRLPFEADTAAKVLRLHLTQPAPDPRAAAPDRQIPASFAELALRSLAKSKDDRPQSARAFGDELRNALLASEAHLATPEASPSTAIRCGTCGKLSPLGQRYCGDCGVTMRPVEARTALSSASAVTPLERPASKPPSAARTPGARTPPPPRGSTAPVSPRPTAAGVATLAPPTPTNSRAPSRPGAAGSPSRPGGSTRTALAEMVNEALSMAAFPMPLLDRENAVAWLEVRRNEAVTMPAAAHVIGETGMGKTRLITEMLDRWSTRGDLVVLIRPDPSWAKIGDAAVRQAVRALAGFPRHGIDPAAWDRASRDARRGLGALFGAEGPMTTQERRAVVAEALRFGLERAAERASRIVLAIDDLDFIDGTSRIAFSDVFSAPPAVPALMVLGYTPGTRPVSEPLPNEVFKLTPLPFELVSRRLSPGVAHPGVALSPLHVEQLIAWTQETADPPPEQLVDLVVRRVERLRPDVRHALYALCVWGNDATLATLEKLLPAAPNAATALDALHRMRLITTAVDEDHVVFPLVRRLVLATIPARQNQELCARAAELRPDAPLEIRAKYAIYGGSTLEALSLLDTLATRRTAHGDLAGSVSAMRHALDLARRELQRGELDDPLEAVLVFARKLAEALAADGRWSDADGVLHEALGNAPPASDHRAHLLGVMAYVANARRHPSEARQYLDEAFQVARQSDLRGLLPILERLEKTIAVA